MKFETFTFQTQNPDYFNPDNKAEIHSAEAVTNAINAFIKENEIDEQKIINYIHNHTVDTQKAFIDNTVQIFSRD
jgi:hypothetical protein